MGINQRVVELMKKGISQEVEFGPVMRYAETVNSSSVDNYVFVEGYTDELFYGNSNINDLNTNAKYYYRKCQDKDSFDFRGKKSVLFCLKRIVENKELSKHIGKCYFIIDRDYTARGINSNSFGIKKVGLERLRVTKGHSMENYFLEKDNLILIFTKLGKKEYIEDFWKKYCYFAETMSGFYAAKAIYTELKESNLLIKYYSKKNESNIFVYNFHEEDFFTSIGDVKKAEKMILQCITHNYYLQKVSYLKKLIAENPLLIRGHDAFDFLRIYLYQKLGLQIDFNEKMINDMKDIISNFEVVLETY